MNLIKCVVLGFVLVVLSEYVSAQAATEINPRASTATIQGVWGQYSPRRNPGAPSLNSVDYLVWIQSSNGKVNPINGDKAQVPIVIESGEQVVIGEWQARYRHGTVSVPFKAESGKVYVLNSDFQTPKPKFWIEIVGESGRVTEPVGGTAR
jgi:hypothetical protein